MRGRSAIISTVWALAWLGCGASSQGPIQPGDPGLPGGTAGGAAITAAAAGAIWAVGGGCRMQGCPYGTYCNDRTGYCEVRKCEQGCPDGTVCNEGLGRCQAAPPAQTPNDFLPQDNRITHPPGTR